MRIGGLASGMDTDQLVKELMNAQKMPLNKLTQKKVWTEWQRDANREFNLSLSKLRTIASDLRFQGSFNAYSATSSNSGSLTASTTANALSGTYQVEVVNVASTAKIHSAGTIEKSAGVAAKSTDLIPATGMITIKDNSGAVLGSVDVTSGLTYADVAKKLQEATAGKTTELRASFDDTTSRFFMSTTGMGADQNFTLEFSDAALANQVINNNGQLSYSTNTAGTNYMSTATNGEVKFDGILVDNLTSNKTTINGLNLNLLQKGTSTIMVQSDTAKPLETIKNLVEKYNETISEIEKKLVEKRYPDFKPLSDEQRKDMSEKEIELWEEKARSGLLRNDPILKNALQELRSAFMDPVAGIATGNMNMLSQIGINTGKYSDGGKLFIDENKLKDALSNKPDEVMDLFTNGTNGIGNRVYAELNDVIKRLSERGGSPTSAVDNSTMSKRITQMNQEISKWNDRLKMVENRYWKQFTAMEKALSQMNSQSSWMQQNMFGGM
ncbi:flagellar filament capping protein FliD [Paenisporosarcina quisquiliarum]|uniref:Flagellar hook-associated protein 2 n=1 Tax=Paenisporosarcina quisquiliarum TaxID=365346 RepID=A0A9X3LGE8_9BACL|nr:flagellar filament capping protein FliD [Paenisporosarcina quisquiliarum]MCZ8536929.1 flagellar filament capping protein FliD [Paenisporosarcina quisquiliarum]